MRKIVLVFIFGLVGVLNASESAQACSCAYSEIKERLKSNDFVAVGKIVGLKHSGDDFDAARLYLQTGRIFKGEKYKGALEKTVQIRMPNPLFGSAACAYEFDLSHEYLVFASERSGDDDTHLFTSLCSMNSPVLGGSNPDLDWLLANVSDKPSPSTK